MVTVCIENEGLSIIIQKLPYPHRTETEPLWTVWYRNPSSDHPALALCSCREPLRVLSAPVVLMERLHEIQTETFLFPVSFQHSHDLDPTESNIETRCRMEAPNVRLLQQYNYPIFKLSIVSKSIWEWNTLEFDLDIFISSCLLLWVLCFCLSSYPF